MLRDVTLDWRRATVALVGPTGLREVHAHDAARPAGRPRPRHVLVDGVDMRDAAPAGHSRRRVALVPQTTFIFDDTVRDNITLGADVADDEVWRPCGSPKPTFRGGPAARAGHAAGRARHHAVRRSAAAARAGPRPGAPTPTADPGRRDLSGRPRRSRPGSSAGYGTRPGRRTVVVVAYRRATIELADEVVYLEQGTVVDRGTHEELLARSAGYRRLVTAYEQAARRRDADATRSADQEAVR